MKITPVLPLLLLCLSGTAFAWPGSRGIVCHSLPGAKQKVSLTISMVGTPTPDMPAEVDVAIGAVAVSLDDPNRTAIAIVDEPKDRVITAAYSERDENHTLDVQVWAKPGTIKGGLDKHTCREKYVFRAGFSGSLDFFGSEPERHASDYGDTLSCEYEMTFGSAGC